MLKLKSRVIIKVSFQADIQIIIYNILMGQGNSEVVQSRTILVQNWQPMENETQVLVNRITHEQVQKHFIRILIKDLPRETALFASRMSNHQPFVCRLLYFHPTVPTPGTPQDNEKDFREMYLYTDRMLPLKDWKQEKVKIAVQGFKRLVSVNGPIKITENMVCQNQNGEIKVWMSQNPVNNHPDSKYMSQEQTVADFATILTKKNKDLAGKLMGCHTLKDILEKFTRTVRENSSPFQNYSHRASDSGDFHKSKFEYKERGQPKVAYRNVFGQPADKKSKDQGFLTPKPGNKNYQNYPQSSFSRVQEECKPKSNMGYVEKMRQNGKNSIRLQTHAEEKSGPVSALGRKYTIQTSLEAKGNILGEDDRKTQTKNSKIEQAQLQQKNKYKLAQTASYTNLQPPYSFHRYETTKLGSTNNLFMPTFTSAKALKSDQWKQYQSKNIGGQGQPKQNSFCNSSAANFPNEEVKRGYDITIINNNVNNFINNITHNHVVKVQKKMPENYQFRSPKTQESGAQINQKMQNSSKKQPAPMNAKDRTEFIPVPVFLQKRRNNNAEETSSPSHSKIQPGFYAKKEFKPINRQPQEPIQSNKPKNQPVYLVQKAGERQSNMPKFTSFNTNNSGISIGQQSSNNTKTPTATGYGQNFTSFMKGNNTSFQLKSGLRTKTTQFFAKTKDINRIDSSIQNKSFTQNQKISIELDTFQEPKYVQKVHSAKIFEEIIEPKPKIDLLSEKIISKEEPVPQQKQNFKKQLRNEFKFLLGGDPQKDEPKIEEPQLSKQSSDISVPKEGKQVQVKDKIIKKQMEFAELKKQALKVLIDI